MQNHGQTQLQLWLDSLSLPVLGEGSEMFYTYRDFSYTGSIDTKINIRTGVEYFIFPSMKSMFYAGQHIIKINLNTSTDTMYSIPVLKQHFFSRPIL